MQQIVAMGGGGFSMEPDNLALDRYVLDQTGQASPAVCFLGQASGESPDYAMKFYRAFTSLGARPDFLSLFSSSHRGYRRFLLSQDVIYVGGGNSKSMLALWREWNLDRILQQALKNGVVLAGISAGCICWFEQGTTDSIPGRLGVLSCLGYLKGSCSPHFDSEAERRPVLKRLLESGEILPGHAFDDGAAGHFVDGELKCVVSSRPDARGYYLDVGQERPLETRYLLADAPKGVRGLAKAKARK